MNYAGMLVYILVAMVTPGPNNLMAMYLCARHGFAGAKRFMIASSASLFAKMLLCGLLNLLLASVIPALVPYLKWLGAAYMLFLAFQIARSGFRGEEQPQQQAQGESTYKSGILLQLLNIKSWVFALSVFSIYLIPYSSSLWGILAVSLLSLLTMVACTLLWGLFGSALQRLYSKYRLPVSLAMAASLLWCAVTAVM